MSIRPQRSWVEDKDMLDVGMCMRLARRVDHFEGPEKDEGSRTVMFAELRTICGEVSRAWELLRGGCTGSRSLVAEAPGACRKLGDLHRK